MQIQTVQLGVVLTARQTDPLYKGEPLPAELAQGPPRQRSCRDPIFCALFLVFNAGMIAVSVVGFIQGKPYMLRTPVNSAGNLCGISPGYQQFPYLYISKFNISLFGCIDYCPLTNTSNVTCKIDGTQSDCISTFGVYKTIPLSTICVPLLNQTTQPPKLNYNVFQLFIVDLMGCYPLVFLAAGFALVFSLLMMLLLIKTGSCVVWVAILVYFLALLALGFAALFQAYYYQGSTVVPFLPGQVVAYGCFFFIFLSVVLLICVCKKLRMANATIRVTTDYLKKNIYFLVVESMISLFLIGFLAYWMVACIFVFSAGKFTSECNSPFQCVNWNNNLRNCLAYLLIALYWDCSYIICLNQYIVSNNIGYWYFYDRSKPQPFEDTCRSLKNAIIFNGGSLALSSLLMPVMVILNIPFIAIRFLFKQSSEGHVYKKCSCGYCCCQCIRKTIHCFERFMRFIDRSGIILMSVSGQSFFQSCHSAFYLYVRSQDTYILSVGVAQLILFFVQLMVTSLSTLFCWLIMTQSYTFRTKNFEPLYPLMLFIVCSYTLSSLFLNILGTGSEALLTFFLVEKDSGKKQLRCPPQLSKLMKDMEKTD